MPEGETKTAEMNKDQVLWDIFGYLSDEEEEVRPETTLNQQDVSHSKTEGDEGSESSESSEGSNFEDEGNAEVKAISRRCARKVTHNYNLRYSQSCDVPHNYNLRSSRSSISEKGKGLVGTSSSSADAVEDLDVEKNNERSLSQESQGGGVLPCEDGDEDEEWVPTPTVYEIPFSHPPGLSDQMVVFELPSLVAIDPRTFEPETFVEQDIYISGPLGIRRRVPQTNVIRWRKVSTPNGETVSESNARFVRWSDGSLQLLIGKQAFDVSERDMKHMYSYIFQQHPMGLYQCLGKVEKQMKVVVASSTCSDSHHHGGGGASVERPLKIPKVREYFADLGN